MKFVWAFVLLLVAVTAIEDKELEEQVDDDPSLEQSVNQILAQAAETDNSKKDAAQPNVVLILVDDLGFNDLGYKNPSIISPNLDTLAQEGLILNNNYVAPICTPSRHTLMTGTYAWKHGMSHLVLGEDQPACSPLELTHLAERMKSAGYATHMIGKWHLGFCSADCTPNSRGFDSFRGLYTGMGKFWEHTVDGGYDWHSDYDVDRSAEGVYTTDIITNRIEELLDGEMDLSKPFFWYVAHTAPHTPLQVDLEYYNMYLDQTFSDDGDSDIARRLYLGMISKLDESIGDMVQKMKDVGVYDNTVFIFSSDNGGEFGTHHQSDNTPLRGGKAGLFEGGSRVIGFVHSALLPDNIKGTSTDEFIHETDWVPTLTHIATGSPADDATLDGMDQYDVIFNGAASARNEIVYNIDMEFPQMFGQAAIRVGDWKLMWGHYGFSDGYANETKGVWEIGADWPLSKRNTVEKRSSWSFSQETTQYMMGVIGRNTFRVDDVDSGLTKLFNLSEDPIEANNLASDPAYADKVLELKSRLQDLINTEYNAPGAEFSEHVEASHPDFNDGAWTHGWC